MTRRAGRRPIRHKSAPHLCPTEDCRAVVLVDGTAIRQKIKKEYEKARRELANAKQQLDQFYQTDVPQFTRWLNANFGALLTELRELAQKLAVEEDLVFRVENEVFFNGTTYARAYQRVLEGRENPEPAPPAGEAEGFDGDRKSPGAGPDFDDFEGGEDPMDAFFKQLFGEFEPGEGPQGRQHRKASRPSARSERPDPSVRVKELYRALVRQLHPDTQQEMTAQKAEWWHQAQEAYQAGDADQLEVILTLCEIGANGTTAHTSASLLQRITAQLKSSIREIKRQMTQRRKDPAWGFSARADREALIKQMRRDLQDDLEELQERWEEVHGLVSGWKAAAERIKPKRARKVHNPGLDSRF